MDDPISLLIGYLPEPWAIRAGIIVLVASIADLVVPDAPPPSRWAIPRTLLHIVAVNRQAAMEQIKRLRRPAP